MIRNKKLFDTNIKNGILNNNKNKTDYIINYYLTQNIKPFFKTQQKDKVFSELISVLENLIFDKGEIAEHLKHNIESIFWIEKAMLGYIKKTCNDNFIPSDFFKLINSAFELCQTSDSDAKKKFLKEIEELFKENSYNFIIKYFNELFDILASSQLDQSTSVIEQGKNLEELLIENIKKRNELFDFEKFEILFLEKTCFNQSMLRGFLARWINILITLSLKKNCFPKIFDDFMPWIIKTKNSDFVKFSCEEYMKNEFLNYFDKKEKKLEQIKNSILSFIKLVRDQKVNNQYKEYHFLNEIIIKIDKYNNLIKEIFPFETFNNFLLLIIQSKEVNESLNEINNNLKNLIEKEDYYNFNKDEFKMTIEKGINNPNFDLKIISLDWYLLIYEKNKENIKEEESNKEIINIILKTIEKNIEQKDNENLFFLMLDRLCKDNILILFDLLSEYILSEKLSYEFKYKIVGYLNNFLIFIPRAKELKESLITPITDKELINDDFLLFEKLYKIYAVNPMCLLIFCISMELYELSWELILSFKNIKLEDDYFKYLAIFVQAIDNKQWNNFRMRFLFPNKNIYFIKCLYGILMLLPQGKAFDILSDRLYSIKGLLKCKNNFDNSKSDKEDVIGKEYIEKFIKLFEEENMKNTK